MELPTNETVKTVYTTVFSKSSCNRDGMTAYRPTAVAHNTILQSAMKKNSMLFHNFLPIVFAYL